MRNEKRMYYYRKGIDLIQDILDSGVTPESIAELEDMFFEAIDAHDLKTAKQCVWSFEALHEAVK